MAFAETAERLFGRGTAIQIYLLAYAGLRISECLALRNDDRFERGEDGCWRVHVREQVAKAARKTLPPKWRKQRWAFVPHWLSDDVTWLLATTPRGGLLFPSPGRRVRADDGTIERVGRGLYPYTNWRARVWDKIAEATPEWLEREDWWSPDRGSPPAGKQSERRWQWSTHALRHASATYLLNDLRLDPDDVAKFLGHRSGVQVWEMYVRVRPNLFGRAGEASRAVGDPRRLV
jgi:integrase